jgi:hypothetical protein
MGKIDDLRKQREQRFAEMQRRAKAHLSSTNANGTAAPPAADPPAPPSPPEPAQERPSPALGRERVDRLQKGRLEPKSAFKPKSALASKNTLKARADVVMTGKCRVCGKVRALQNGLLVNHQKGLGKPCTGSRKKPAGA